ncbi:MAG: putative toxin-antitoxin system toxin component, PIN family [Chitinophagales bacterium]|nr:putative toxin-antitoxin system toxin component, PIN family [Chitinophagales bacterium]
MKSNLIVIDTNVFISSIIGQLGYPRRIFDELVLTNEIQICLSETVLLEYYEVANRERFKKYKDFNKKANELIEAIKLKAIWFSPKEEIDILPDKDDNKFIELAVEANANYIVTGNTNDFIITEFRGIKIYTPKQFYEEWIKNEID